MTPINTHQNRVLRGTKARRERQEGKHEVNTAPPKSTASNPSNLREEDRLILEMMTKKNKAAEIRETYNALTGKDFAFPDYAPDPSEDSGDDDDDDGRDNNNSRFTPVGGGGSASATSSLIVSADHSRKRKLSSTGFEAQAPPVKKPRTEATKASEDQVETGPHPDKNQPHGSPEVSPKQSSNGWRNDVGGSPELQNNLATPIISLENAPITTGSTSSIDRESLKIQSRDEIVGLPSIAELSHENHPTKILQVRSSGDTNKGTIMAQESADMLEKSAISRQDTDKNDVPQSLQLSGQGPIQRRESDTEADHVKKRKEPHYGFEVNGGKTKKARTNSFQATNPPDLPLFPSGLRQISSPSSVGGAEQTNERAEVIQTSRPGASPLETTGSTGDAMPIDSAPPSSLLLKSSVPNQKLGTSLEGSASKGSNTGFQNPEIGPTQTVEVDTAAKSRVGLPLFDSFSQALPPPNFGSMKPINSNIAAAPYGGLLLPPSIPFNLSKPNLGSTQVDQGIRMPPMFSGPIASLGSLPPPSLQNVEASTPFSSSAPSSSLPPPILGPSQSLSTPLSTASASLSASNTRVPTHQKQQEPAKPQQKPPKYTYESSSGLAPPYHQPFADCEGSQRPVPDLAKCIEASIVDGSLHVGELGDNFKGNTTYLRYSSLCERAATSLSSDFDIFQNEVQKEFENMSGQAATAISQLFSVSLEHLRQIVGPICDEICLNHQSLATLLTGTTGPDSWSLLKSNLGFLDDEGTKCPSAKDVCLTIFNAILTGDVWAGRISENLGVPALKKDDNIMKEFAFLGRKSVREEQARRWAWRDMRRTHLNHDKTVQDRRAALCDKVMAKFKHLTASLTTTHRRQVDADMHWKWLRKIVNKAIYVKCRMEMASRKYEVRWEACTNDTYNATSMEEAPIWTRNLTGNLETDRKLQVRFAQGPVVYVQNLSKKLAASKDPMGLEADERNWLLECLPSDQAQDEGFKAPEVIVKAQVHFLDPHIDRKLPTACQPNTPIIQVQDAGQPTSFRGREDVGRHSTAAKIIPTSTIEQQSCLSEALWSNRLLALARRHISGSLWPFSSPSASG